MPSFLTYAYNSIHQLVHVDTVPLGDACGCVCPNCNAPLCAKNQGKVKEHHFAHAHGHMECESACETTLHILAKQVFQENPNSQIIRF